MKNQMIFQRYEFKYLMTCRQQQAILNAMEPYMVPDGYSHSSIRNLYLDSPIQKCTICKAARHLKCFGQNIQNIVSNFCG